MNALFTDAIFDSLHESALVLSTEGVIEQANRAFLESFHRSAAEVTGCRLPDLGGVWATTDWKSLFAGTDHPTPNAALFGVELRDTAGGHHIAVSAHRLPAATDGEPERIFVAIEDFFERDHAAEIRALHDRTTVVELQRELLLRDVLSAATEGKLHLCLSASDLPPRPAPPVCDAPLTLPTLHDFRHQVREASRQIGMSDARVDDFENAVGEAAMNAVLHGGNGAGAVIVADRFRIQVWVTDTGSGIPVADLPRALLEKGFSSKGTMGQGLKIILQTADRVYLHSSGSGTTLVLEQEREAPLPAWMFALNDFEL